ncbi:MAG: DUF480 domain-containing protein [bacterium]|nr:DUF480 domain-containing protein [bacterium]MCP4966306.1 DUF480 domain-containing protein [bacterium]
MKLTDHEARVLGCLVEKEMTTPDYYPMTVNSLAGACNQKSNRSPVVEYTETEVVTAVDGLRHHGMARTVHGKGDRSLKYKHVVGEILEVTPRQAALLAVLLLRGDQTVGELRTRTGRYTEFADLDDVAAELAELAAAEEPKVEMLQRRPGEKESRYRHLLGEETAAQEMAAAPPAETDDDAGRVAELEAELAQLRDRVTRMERELGLD